jgi:hypothetical protein
LLKIDQVKWIDEVPNYPELSSRKIWEMLGNDPVISKYFPVYSKSRAPHKQYLLNVINTIRPNSIATAVQKLKTKRF